MNKIIWKPSSCKAFYNKKSSGSHFSSTSLRLVSPDLNFLFYISTCVWLIVHSLKGHSNNEKTGLLSILLEMEEHSAAELGRKLNKYERLYLYGLHGFAIEVVFCALWFLIANKNIKLHGYSSVWSFLIYGIGLLLMERIRIFLHTRKINVFYRGAIYLIWTYAWELLWGVILLYFDCHSWDYSGYSNYHLWGLINFEYAPLWFISSIIADVYLIRFVSHLRWTCSSQDYSPRPPCCCCKEE